MAPTLTPRSLVLKPGTAWTDAWQRCPVVAPEAFRDERILNLWDARRQADGRVLPFASPVDGTLVAGPPRLDAATARQAVRACLDQHRAWRHVPLPERRARVAATLDALTEHRELLSLLLVWEIGKPWRLAQADVDRAIEEAAMADASRKPDPRNADDSQGRTEGDLPGPLRCCGKRAHTSRI